MKYHSPIKIIILSLILVAVFLSVSVWLTIGLGMPSIARFYIDEFTDTLVSPSDDLTVSFDRVNSNLRGNITLEGVSLSMKDSEIATIDSLRINNGFTTIVKNLLTRKGTFDIRLAGVDVFIPEGFMDGDIGKPVPDVIDITHGLLDTDGVPGTISYLPGMAGNLTAGSSVSDGGAVGIIGGADGPTAVWVSSSSLPDFDFLLNMKDLRVEVEGIVAIENVELSAVYGLRSGEYTAEVAVPYAGFSAEGMEVGVSSVTAVAEGNSSGLDFRASSDVMDLSVRGFDFKTHDFALNLNIPSFAAFDLYSVPVGLSMKSLEAEKGDDIYLKAEPLSLMVEDGRARLSIKGIIAALGNYALSTSDIHVGTDIRTFDTDLSVVSAVMWQDVADLVKLDGITASGSPDGSMELFISEASVPAIKGLTDGFFTDFIMEDTAFGLEIGKDLKLSVDSTGLIESGEDLIDGSTFSLRGNVTKFEEGLDARVSLGTITMPAVTEPLDVDVSWIDGKAKLDAGISDRVSINIGYDGKLEADIEADNFTLALFRPVLDKLAPSLHAYWNDQTALNGKLSASIGIGEKGIEGPTNFMFALSGVSFNDLDLSVVASSSAEFNGNELRLDDFNISSPYIRTVFSGSIDLSSLIPSGRFSILTTEKGKYIADLDLEDLGEKEFSFDLGLFNDKDITLSGRFSYADREHLWSDAVLRVQGGEYQIGFDIDFRESLVSVVNDRGYFGMKFGDGFDAVLHFDEFMFPSRDGNEPTTLDGQLTFTFDFSSQHFEAGMDRFMVYNLNFIPGQPDLEITFALDPEMLDISEFNILSPEFIPMKGSFEYNFDEKSVAAAILSDEEKMLFSLIDVDDVFSGLLSFVNVDSKRFGFEMGRINALLMGRGSSIDDIGFSGDFNIRPLGNPKEGLGGRISITQDLLRIDDVLYKDGNLELGMPGLTVSAKEGKAELPLSFNFAFDNDDRLYPVSADIKLEILSEPGVNLFEYGKAIAAAGLGGISGKLYVNDISIDRTLSTGARYSTIESNGGMLTLEGNFLQGSFDPEALALDFAVDLSPIAKLRVDGSLKNGMDLHVGLQDLNLSAVNMTIGSPIFVITDDSFASGSIYLTGPFSDLKFYGYVWTDKMTADVFWVPDDRLIVNNALFILWDNNIKSLMSGVTAVDKYTGRRRPGKLQVEVNFNPGLSFDFFRLDAWIEEGNDISLRIPITSANIDLLADVSGHFYLNMTADKTKIGGEIVLSDFLGSFGLHPLPEWWSPGGDTSDMDFDIVFRKNSDIVFPLGPNPILKATIDENQHLGFSIDGNDITIRGKLKLRTGELFYFQNYFYIREGEVEFIENDLNAIEPVINLRAQLRDFDENGDKIDIWLTLMDARLNSINPVLSSSPSRDTSEIMNILGQTIVGNEPQGTLGSVVSLVSTGVDVLSRIGILDTGSDGSLQNSIRTSLNLDAFSLHSNIVENIVFDAISTNDLGGVTPLARYLDGTSLYIGKHITPEIYLEVLAHLVARRGILGEDISFLSSDLSLDIEISAEWDNPLCSVRIFTQPSYINFQEIFDTLGFTLSKRFVF